MPCDFAEDVANYADAGLRRHGGLADQARKSSRNVHSAADTPQLLADRGMTLAAAAYQGGLLLSQGDARKAHFDQFRGRLDLCQEFGIKTLLVVADFVDKIDRPIWSVPSFRSSRRRNGLPAYGVTLGLEFRGKTTFCASLDTALALVEQCGEPNVGVNLDIFHYYTGPSKFEDFARLNVETPRPRADRRPVRRAARIGDRRRPHPARRRRFPARADPRRAARLGL